MWQDLVFSIGNLFFLVGVVNSIRAPGTAIPRTTSMINFGVLVTFGLAFLSLALWWSALATYVTAACWLWIAYKKATPTR